MQVASKIFTAIVILLYFTLGYHSVASAQQTPAVEIISGASNSGLVPPFNPSMKTVTLTGQVTVIWKNNDDTYHTVTSVTNSFESPPIAPQSTWNTTFSSMGSYNYFCSFHPYMTGTIVVVNQ